MNYVEISDDIRTRGSEERTPVRVVVVGRDISVGSRPIANSVSVLLVAFMLANS